MEEGKGVSVHGIPVYVSPVNESSRTQGVRYFEAKLSDGKKCARVKSFDPSHRDAIKKAEENQEVVLLANSTAKKKSFSSETEIHLDKNSTLLESPRKISLGDVVPFTKAVKIADIVKASVGQNLDVTFKVVEISNVEQVKKKNEDGHEKEIRKQEVKVGDETGSCRLVLWEVDIESLEEGMSYQLVDVGVHQFSGKKYLSYLKTSTKEGVTNPKDVSGVISTVISTEYRCCKVCRRKVEMQENVLATCIRYSALMRIACCEESQVSKIYCDAGEWL